MEIVDVAIAIYGNGRVGVRLAPGGSFGDVHSDDCVSVFQDACRRLSQRGVAYVHLIEPGTQGTKQQNAKYPG